MALLRKQGEAQNRQALEKTVQEMNGKHQAELKSMAERHEQEVQSLRDVWEEEKDKLIRVVQKQCNIVFDRTRSRSSPRCVSSALDFFSEQTSVYEPLDSGDALSPKSKARSPGITSNRTPSFSELSKSLRETEALVHSIVNSPMRP